LTVTHSWVSALELGLGLGLLVTSAASEAEDADWDGDEEAEEEADADDELVWEVDPDGEAGGDWLGSLPGLPPVPGELVDGELVDGELVDGEGEGDGEGLGDGEAVDGSAWHVVAVSLAAAARRAVTDSAWAAPGRTVSPANSTKLPASKLAAPVRTCLKRMIIACLRCSSGWLAARCGFGGDLVVDGHEYSYPLRSNLCTHVTPDHGCAMGGRSRQDVTVPAPGSVPFIVKHVCLPAKVRPPGDASVNGEMPAGVTATQTTV
jgi:hypothetical protein